MSKEYIISTEEEKGLLKDLESRQDAEALRMKRYLAMSDLTRKEGNPLKEIVEEIKQIPEFKNFDVIKVPEVVPISIVFDLFDFPENHVARSKSDTYFVDEKNVLRPHTTVMWYYYLNLPEIKERLKNKETVGVFCHGKVYRKDEIDRKHMNVFHQIDGLYLIPKSEKEITLKDLQDVEATMATTIFGKDVKYRFNEETFPYTHPSTEVEIERTGDWLEILGSGVVKGSVLEKLGVDSSVYNGWAFGPGIDRWAMISTDLPDIRLLWSDYPRVKTQLKMGQKFVEVSKYPPVVRDISFVVKNDFVPNDYFDLVRETAPGLVEQVELLDKYENVEKFGKNNISYAFRVTYRSLDKTLTSTEIDSLHKKLEEMTTKMFMAKVR